MTKKYSKLKMFGLYALSLFVNLLPLLIVLLINWEACTKTKREGVAISVTGIAWIIFLVMTMLGTMPKRVNRVVTLVIVFVVLELMKPLLSYMCIFAGASAIGAMIDIVAVRPFINRYKEYRLATKTAQITTEQVKEAVKEIIKTENTGRV